MFISLNSIFDKYEMYDVVFVDITLEIIISEIFFIPVTEGE